MQMKKKDFCFLCVFLYFKSFLLHWHSDVLLWVREVLLLETLRSRFGDLTTNGKPRFAVSGFTLAVCPYLGLKIRGLNSRLPCLFLFVR